MTTATRECETFVAFPTLFARNITATAYSLSMFSTTTAETVRGDRGHHIMSPIVDADFDRCTDVTNTLLAEVETGGYDRRHSVRPVHPTMCVYFTPKDLKKRSRLEVTTLRQGIRKDGKIRFSLTLGPKRHAGGGSDESAQGRRGVNPGRRGWRS